MATALPLYFPSLERLVGRHQLLAQVHLWAGVALPFPLLLTLLGPWGARMRRDVRRISRWSEDELRWLLRLGRRAPAVQDKFNPGQKLNAIFVAGATVVLLGTGLLMHFFGVVPVSWRTGATFVHDLLAAAVFLVVAGHVALALAHPAALRSMVSGRVSEAWAARHAPGWLLEEGAAGSRPGAPAPGDAAVELAPPPPGAAP